LAAVERTGVRSANCNTFMSQTENQPRHQDNPWDDYLSKLTDKLDTEESTNPWEAFSVVLFAPDGQEEIPYEELDSEEFEPLKVICLLSSDQTLTNTRQKNPDTFSSVVLDQRQLATHPELNETSVKGVSIECWNITRDKFNRRQAVVFRFKITCFNSRAKNDPNRYHLDEVVNTSVRFEEGDVLNLRQLCPTLEVEDVKFILFQVKSIDFINKKVVIGPVCS
jgi:hypothetical protein